MRASARRWPSAFWLCSSLGGLIGFINGFMVVRLRLSAFIVTLAMLIILRGMLVGATSGRTLFDLPDAFYGLMVITFLGLPLAVWLAAFAFAVAGVMLRYHRLGRALYAIGGNPDAECARINWMFTTQKARAKMGRAYPKPTLSNQTKIKESKPL